MAFQEGHKKHGGRQKGTPNRITKEVSQLLFKNIGRKRPIIGFNRIKVISKLQSLNEENR